jgi:type I restriction enzyme M protein
MLSPHIKKKVDELWNKFWSAGITNPLVAIEQITYLLFLKRLEALDNQRVKKRKTSIYKDHEDCRWSHIRQDRTPKHLIDVVFPWLRELEKKLIDTDASANGIEAIGNRMSDAYFQLDPNKGTILSDAITLIDKLFERVDTIGGSTDIMGDTFEYLLSEISTAGKNGQFRTPRHIIRLMVELLDPKPGARVIDPAAGTGGFLFSTINHILKNNTPPDNLRIEWDGTPHRANGENLSPEAFKQVHNGQNFVGFDNDRTMVRIGWMNMILHGIENPQIHQRDSLGKRKEDDQLHDLRKSESYDYVLANPPFTGSVDSADLELSTFPTAGKTGKKSGQAITNKSELLFVWVMLDLLRVGGRCAVIVPEGVLFGSTDAHVQLRKELLTEHLIEGIISLPGGAFQPYTGVKTSIIIFQKETRKEDRNSWKPHMPPRTQKVWFYEVQDEVFTLDARRIERRGQNNDLWDAQEQYKQRNNVLDYYPHDYYQPEYHTERWRLVDDETVKVFADVAEVARWKGKVAAVHELFDKMPADPGQALKEIEERERPALQKIAQDFLNRDTFDATQIEKRRSKAAADFRSLCNQQKGMFDQDEQVAWTLFQKAFQAAGEQIISSNVNQVAELNLDNAKTEVQRSAKEYAKLDGYDVMLRSLQINKQSEPLITIKSWFAPVRVYARNDEWQSEDSRLKGSHDESDNLRPEYAAIVKVYDDKGNLIEGALDPDCIEARGWNLSAGQYKPITYATIKSDKNVADMIRDIKSQEQLIVQGLDKLLAMVEGRE